LVVVTIQAAAGRLVAFGRRPGQARSLAITMLASQDGAFVLTRVLRSIHIAEDALFYLSSS